MSYRLSGAFLLGCLGLMIENGPFVSAQTVYVMTNQNQFGTMDLATGNFTSISTTTPRFFAIAFTSHDQLYGVDSASKFYAINPDTGASTQIGGTYDVPFTRLASSGSGTLFADTNTTGTDPSAILCTVNPQTGTKTEIGSTGLTSPRSTRGAMAFGPDNTLYTLLRTDTTSHFSLATRNLATGAAALIGDSGFGSAASGIFGLVSVNQSLYGVVHDSTFGGSNGTVVTFNTATGLAVSTGITPGVFGINGLAVRPAAAPSPSAAAVLFGGLLPGLLLMHRRKKAVSGSP